ncbi:P-loop containing nucleoside triphosphate hydrolase, partial [Globisporangium splendens]
MFKGFTKDLAGTADICSAVTDFSKLHAQTYLVPDGDEQILFGFESGKEEFAFTNQALITVSGENATTTRKLIERFEYRDFAVTNVQFETTGRVDRDCEIKFTLGGEKRVSIDTAKKEEDAVKKYYKDGLQSASQSLRLGKLEPTDGEDGLVGHASQTLGWLTQDYERLNSRCYKSVIVNALADHENSTIQVSSDNAGFFILLDYFEITSNLAEQFLINGSSCSYEPHISVTPFARIYEVPPNSPAAPSHIQKTRKYFTSSPSPDTSIRHLKTRWILYESQLTYQLTKCLAQVIMATLSQQFSLATHHFHSLRSPEAHNVICTSSSTLMEAALHQWLFRRECLENCIPVSSDEFSTIDACIPSSETIVFALSSKKEDFVVTDHAVWRICHVSRLSPFAILRRRDEVPRRCCFKRFAFKDHRITEVSYRVCGQIDVTLHITIDSVRSIKVGVIGSEEAEARAYFRVLQRRREGVRANKTYGKPTTCAEKEDFDTYYWAVDVLHSR